MRPPLSALVVLVIALAPVTGAHSVTYAATTLSPHTSPLPTFWYGTWVGGHIVPSSGGTAILTILDATGPPKAGFACQDLDGDAQCGANPTELQVSFCNSVVITDATNGGVWEPADPIYVFETLMISCGPSAWVSGSLDHT